MGQHRKVWRACPVCGQTKYFEARAKTCSVECGRKMAAAKATGASERESAEQGNVESSVITGDTWVISLPRTRIHTLEQLLDYAEVDRTLWEVERFVVNKWEVGAKTDKGIEVAPLYQVKAWLKRKRNAWMAREELERMKQEAQKWAPRYSRLPSLVQSDILLELSLPDLHFGRLAWAEETGADSYDSGIAAERFRTAVTKILSRAAGFKPSHCLLVVGNDNLNFDNIVGATSAGTVQDVDTRYQKVFRLARSCYIWAIDSILGLGMKVTVLVVPGNHDMLAAWHLGDSLQCWYRSTDRVTVDASACLRKYFRWGRVGLMFVHGDRVKLEDMPLLFARERPDIWGSTEWREVHTGDKHHTRVLERYGVRVRILPSLASESAWEARHGYLGSVKAAEAFLWSQSDGLVATIVHVLPSPEPRKAS